MKTQIIIIALVAILTVTCSSNEQELREAQGKEERLTEKQRALADVRTGPMQRRVLSAVVTATGEIEVPPEGIASVSVPFGGYLVRTSLVPGDYVKKGAVLAELSNPEYITLQQSWLETAGELKFARQDYERQKTLEAHDATAGRRLQESESAYSVLKARLAGLREQLRLVGVDMKRLERGEIQPVVALTAPVTGYITEVNHHPGEFIEPRESVFQIVNPADLHLHLNVFERDISRVEIGQRISFEITGDDALYWAQVALISPKRDNELRTFNVHAHIEGNQKGLKPGMYVEADILLSNDTVPVLPVDAVVSWEGKSYVLTEHEGRYQPREVETGTRTSDWVEIRNGEALAGHKLVVSGASRVFAALRRTSE